MLFFSAGLRTPLLALLALRRPRTLALVLVPYAPAIAVTALLGPLLSADGRIGLGALTVVPGLLLGPPLARSIGGRADRAGALMTGTLAAAFALHTLGGAVAFGQLQNGFLAFVIGASIVATVPMLPALFRAIGEIAGYAAFAVLVAIAVVDSATGVDPAAVAAGGALFVAVAGTAVLAARLLRVEPESALAGSGSRDIGIAAGLAVSAGGPGAASAPLGFGILLLLVSAALVWNRRKAR